MATPTPTDIGLSLCDAELAYCNVSLANMTDMYQACANFDPCAATPVVVYDLGLHIAAVFIILFMSGLGAALPLIAKYNRIGISPYMICLGKCMGIGVVLACALVHMLQPAAQSLTSPCVPWEFNTDYNAYAYLYCMLAGLMMQFVDYNLMRYMIRQQNRKAAERVGSTSQAAFELNEKSIDAVDEKNGTDNNNVIPASVGAGHFHPTLITNPLDSDAHKLVAAYMLEFGVTVHSVFIGLTVGVVDQATLEVLLVAYVHAHALPAVRDRHPAVLL